MISLEASTRTCKVDTASAARIESDRFLNPNLAVCPNFSGRDLSGRQVCRESFMTKSAGCNKASERVLVENALRPQYMEYINLDATGIRGSFYANNQHYQEVGARVNTLDEASRKSGHFGGVFSGGTNKCTGYSLGDGFVETFELRKAAPRYNAQVTNGYRSCRFKSASGF